MKEEIKVTELNNMPKDALSIVFSEILDDLQKLKTVCRRWKNLLNDTSFQRSIMNEVTSKNKDIKVGLKGWLPNQREEKDDSEKTTKFLEAVSILKLLKMSAADLHEELHEEESTYRDIIKSQSFMMLYSIFP